MSDVYLMLGLGLDQCSETQDYLSSGRPMQLVGHGMVAAAKSAV